jgi:hypothetical protein
MYMKEDEEESEPLDDAFHLDIAQVSDFGDERATTRGDMGQRRG